MKSNRLKKETVEMIDKMIQHADKGPSGFWTDDYEGCGNPEIFPEFSEGLKHGRLVQKEHFYCPWNKAIMYGNEHGSLLSGCYYSCAIRDAKYLSAEMLTAVLERFKSCIINGQYDEVQHIQPLLTADEQNYIVERKKQKAAELEAQKKQEARLRKSKASKLLKKYAGNKEVCDLLCAYYGTEVTVNTDKFGLMFFSSKSKNDVVGAERLSYDEYLEAQINSAGKYRVNFLHCYMNIPSEFKGEVEKIDSINNRICFKRIFVTGMFPDDCSFFDGKEEHVWMSKEAFGNCSVGDCFAFWAEVYRYIKTGHGRSIDYALRNPKSIKKIEKYELPTDKELALQEISWIICESCYLSENCSHISCMRNSNEIKDIQESMLRGIGKFDKDGNKK